MGIGPFIKGGEQVGTESQWPRSLVMKVLEHIPGPLAWKPPPSSGLALCSASVFPAPPGWTPWYRFPSRLRPARVLLSFLLLSEAWTHSAHFLWARAGDCGFRQPGHLTASTQEDRDWSPPRCIWKILGEGPWHNWHWVLRLSTKPWGRWWFMESMLCPRGWSIFQMKLRILEATAIWRILSVSAEKLEGSGSPPDTILVAPAAFWPHSYTNIEAFSLTLSPSFLRELCPVSQPLKLAPLPFVWTGCDWSEPGLLEPLMGDVFGLLTSFIFHFQSVCIFESQVTAYIWIFFLESILS